MNNSEYWIKRLEELEKAQILNETKYTEMLKEEYEKALVNIKKETRSWLVRFSINNQISLKDSKKWLNTNELKELKWDINEYIKYGQENGIDLIWKKELENASAKVHIARLESLQMQIQQEIEKLSYQEQYTTEDFIIETYKDTYYKLAYELQKGHNIAFQIATLDLDTIKKVISKPWTTDELTFSDRIWKNKQALINTLQTELTQAIIRGKAPDEIIEKISKTFGVSKNKASTLVMTESAFFSSTARKQCFNDLGVERYEIVATLDSRTSEICRELDGKVNRMSDYKEGTTAPPFHVRCRSTTAPYFEDEFEFGERAARDVNGKTYYVPSNIKYNEWLEKYVYSNSETKKAFDLDVKMNKNKSSDYEQYTRYKNVFGNELNKSFEEFQEMKYNNSNEYSDWKSYYQYKSTYPESNRTYYEINNNIKELISNGQVKSSLGTAISPSNESVEIGSINTHALNRMTERGITKETAQTYIDNAVVQFSQNNKMLYLSEEGATVLLKEDKRFITTYSKDDFEDSIKNILEVIKNGK